MGSVSCCRRVPQTNRGKICIQDTEHLLHLHFCSVSRRGEVSLSRLSPFTLLHFTLHYIIIHFTLLFSSPTQSFYFICSLQLVLFLDIHRALDGTDGRVTPNANARKLPWPATHHLTRSRRWREKWAQCCRFGIQRLVALTTGEHQNSTPTPTLS